MKQRIHFWLPLLTVYVGLSVSIVSMLLALVTLWLIGPSHPNLEFQLVAGLRLVGTSILGLVVAQAGLTAREQLQKVTWEKISAALTWHNDDHKFMTYDQIIAWVESKRSPVKFLMSSRGYGEDFLMGLESLMKNKNVKLEILLPHDWDNSRLRLASLKPEESASCSLFRFMKQENFPGILLIQDKLGFIIWPGNEGSPQKWRVLAREEAGELLDVFETAKERCMVVRAGRMPSG